MIKIGDVYKSKQKVPDSRLEPIYMLISNRHEFTEYEYGFFGNKKNPKTRVEYMTVHCHIVGGKYYPLLCQWKSLETINEYWEVFSEEQ